MRASEYDTGGEQHERDRQELEVIEVSDDEDDGLMLLAGSIPDFITLTAMSTPTCTHAQLPMQLLALKLFFECVHTHARTTTITVCEVNVVAQHHIRRHNSPQHYMITWLNKNNSSDCAESHTPHIAAGWPPSPRRAAHQNI